MDAYIHAVLEERIPLALAQPEIPDALANVMADLLPIKNGSGFKVAYPVLSATDTAAVLTAKLQNQTLQFLSYQAPEKNHRRLQHDRSTGHI
jgi:hypothetical protein